MLYCLYTPEEPDYFAMDESMQLYLMRNEVGEIIMPPPPPSVETTQQSLNGSSALQYPDYQHQQHCHEHHQHQHQYQHQYQHPSHPQYQHQHQLQCHRQQQPQHHPHQLQHQQPAGFVPTNEIRPTDVFCSRDKASHTHPGNKRFRQLIISYREQYQKLLQRDEKTKLTNEIVNIVHNYGGRFLKQHDSTGCWYEVNYTVAHEKVSHALRSAKDPNRPKAQRPTRKPLMKPPTHDEDRMFESLAREQQQLFATLTRTSSEKGKTGHNIMDGQSIVKTVDNSKGKLKSP